MKKGKEYTGIVERVAFPNRGIVAVEGEDDKAEIKNVIPGQKLRFAASRKRKKTIGRLIEVVEKSPLETEPDPCPHFPECGGCLYQTITYESQLELKEQQIKELLSPLFDYDGVYRGMSQSPLIRGYRNKMELSFGDSEKDGELMLGMHRRGSFYDVLDTTDCYLMDSDMRLAAKTTLEFFREHGIGYYHKRTHKGYLRHLLLRKAKNTGEMLICLITSTDFSPGYSTDTEEKLLLKWKESLIEKSYEGTVSGILHTKNDRQADVVCDEGTTILFGKDSFTEKLLGLSFQITPFSFFQTNSKGAEVLYEIAKRAVRNETDSSDGVHFGRVFDLYSGTGTIAQILSDSADEVTGVEIVPEAVEAARKNAVLNGIENCRFIAGDVLKVVEDLPEKPDYIILDPPRDGIHPKALPKILSFGVENILYISCKATSLARDLPSFFEAGYAVKDLWIVDLFPGTGNVEVIVGLQRTDT